MGKILVFLLVFKLLLIPGCGHKQNEEINTVKQANIYLKGTLLQLSNDEIISIIRQTDNILAQGEFPLKYTLSPGAIQEVKENEQFLEITFQQNRFVMTDKLGKIEFRQIMIPLSGRFAQPENLTIFYGTSGYDNPPLICGNGYKELKELLIGIEY